MSQPTASTSTLPPTPAVLASFAGGLITILSLWPALRLAVSESWGGPESADKRTWMASALLDAFEATAAEGGVEEDDLVDMLGEIMVEEFGTELEDGSLETVAKDIIRLWGEVLVGDEKMLKELEVLELSQRGKKVEATNGGMEDDELSSGEEEDGDEDWEDDEAPKLVVRERKEPEVDEEGFTMVQGKGRR